VTAGPGGDRAGRGSVLPVLRCGVRCVPSSGSGRTEAGPARQAQRGRPSEAGPARQAQRGRPSGRAWGMRKRGVAVLAVALAVSGCGTAAVAGQGGLAPGTTARPSVPRVQQTALATPASGGTRRPAPRAGVPGPPPRPGAARPGGPPPGGPPGGPGSGGSRPPVPPPGGPSPGPRPSGAPPSGPPPSGRPPSGPPPSGPPPSGPPPSGPPPSGPPPSGPPPSGPPAACHPRTSGGHCYRPGGYCPPRDHGKKGVAGDGKKIICEDKKGWRWETY
jgi:hypothetical protein